MSRAHGRKRAHRAGKEGARAGRSEGAGAGAGVCVKRVAADWRGTGDLVDCDGNEKSTPNAKTMVS